MLPQGSHLSYQTLPNPGQYCFDLKVNVDFNSGKVNLNVPQNLHPFSKKQEIPVVYTSQGGYAYQYPNHSMMGTSNQPVMSSYQQIPNFQGVTNYVRNDQIYSSAHAPYPVDHSEIIRYSGNYKTKSANDTYPDTFSSFSYNLEKSLDAVNCVICDKPVNREQFHAHLEEHKGRKKEYGRNDFRASNEPTSKMPSFSVRNENSVGQVAEIYKEHPSRNSYGYQQRDPSNSRRQQPNSSISLSRQIEDTHSRIVYAPRDPSQIVYSNHSQSGLNYSKSSGYESVNFKPENAPRSMTPAKEPSISHASASMQNLTRNQNYPSNVANPSLSQNNRSSSQNVLPTELSRRLETEKSRSSQSNLRQNNMNQSVKRNLNIRQNKSQGPPDYYNLNLTQSQIVQPSKQRYSLEDCDQSMINHLNNISRFSKQSSIGELRKQLQIQQIQEEDSSQDEDLYYSLKPSDFQRRAYTSVDPSRIRSKMESSKMTNGLNRTKMPINNLAVQQFIQNPMYYSCYRSTHRF